MVDLSANSSLDREEISSVLKEAKGESLGAFRAEEKHRTGPMAAVAGSGVVSWEGASAGKAIDVRVAATARNVRAMTLEQHRCNDAILQ